MCCCFGATSVKMILDATSDPAQRIAVCLRLLSPSSGNRKSQSTALGSRASIRSQLRKVVGSICRHDSVSLLYPTGSAGRAHLVQLIEIP